MTEKASLQGFRDKLSSQLRESEQLIATREMQACESARTVVELRKRLLRAKIEAVHELRDNLAC